MDYSLTRKLFSKSCAARLAVGVVVVIASWSAMTPAAAAVSEKYQYKFPCAPGQECYYTQGPHVNNALDFQIGNLLGTT
jgi:hypothetical protein